VKDHLSTVSVTVKPRSKRAAVSFAKGAVVVCVREPPHENRANDACRKALAGALGVPVSTVFLLRGRSSRRKVFEIRSLTRSELQRRIGDSPND